MATLNLSYTNQTSTTTCTHSEHNPKVGLSLSEGVTHRCPACGYSFHVSHGSGFMLDQPGFTIR